MNSRFISINVMISLIKRARAISVVLIFFYLMFGNTLIVSIKKAHPTGVRRASGYREKGDDFLR